jgi:hypothetical protein
MIDCVFELPTGAGADQHSSMCCHAASAPVAGTVAISCLVCACHMLHCRAACCLMRFGSSAGGPSSLTDSYTSLCCIAEPVERRRYRFWVLLAAPCHLSAGLLPGCAAGVPALVAIACAGIDEPHVGSKICFVIRRAHEDTGRTYAMRVTQVNCRRVHMAASSSSVDCRGQQRRSNRSRARHRPRSRHARCTAALSVATSPEVCPVVLFDCAGML